MVAKTKTQSPFGIMLPIANIIPCPTNPRKTFDEAKLQELAETIKFFGVLEPILLRPAKGWQVAPGRDGKKEGWWCGNVALKMLINFSTKPGDAEAKLPKWEIVAGERRFRAAQLAGLTEIPAIVTERTDREMLEVQVIENEQRDDVAPVEKAHGYRRLIDDHHYTPEVIAEKVGKSKATIYGLLKLCNLPPEAETALAVGKITLNHAILIGRIPNAELREKATKKILEPPHWSRETEGGAMHFREAKDLVEEEFTVELKGAPFDRKSLTLIADAGSCEACPKMTGNNRAEYPDGRADICTDPACFRAKVKAHQEAQIAKAQAKGLKTLTAAESKIWDNYGNVPDRSPYVPLEVRSFPGERRTWKELVGKELKDEVCLAFDKYGKKHEVVPRDRAEAILAEKGILQGSGHFHGSNGNGSGSKNDWKKQQEERERKSKERSAFSGLFGKAVLGQVADGNVDRIKAARWLFLKMANETPEFMERIGLLAEEEDVDDKKLVDRLPQQDFLAGMTAMEAAACVPWSGEALESEKLKEAAELFKLDLKALQKEAKELLKKEAEPKPKVELPNYAEQMKAAKTADEGRAIFSQHCQAAHDEEKRLGLKPTVGQIGELIQRGFSTLTPAERKKMAAKSPRLKELVEQFEAMQDPWEKLLAAEHSKFMRPNKKAAKQKA